MAAPMKSAVTLNLAKTLSNLRIKAAIHGNNRQTSYLLSDLGQNYSLGGAQRHLSSASAVKLPVSCFRCRHNGVKSTRTLVPGAAGFGERRFTTSRHLQNPEENDDSSDKLPKPELRSKRPLRLMDFRELIWPNPWKTLRNYFMSVLISGYMENTFTTKYFLEGAEQALTVVSNLISRGKFDDLEGLVSREALREIRQHYRLLSTSQRQMLAVDPSDIYYRFVYEIGMIFDDDTEKRFVEITAVFQGYRGLSELRQAGETPGLTEMEKASENMYVCNYRFIREYTKGIGDSTEWTINKLNHFSPKDIVKNTSLFSR